MSVMHVCSQLSQPDANGLQVCLEWVLINQSILPPLTLEATILGGVSGWFVLSLSHIEC